MAYIMRPKSALNQNMTKVIIMCDIRFYFGVILAGLITSTQAMPVLPDFDVDNFDPNAPINNPYFPILDFSNTYVYEGEFEEEGEIVTEGFSLTNINMGPMVLGVQTTTQLDRSYEDGVLVEETHDYYAQDVHGNVWYMGEDVKNFIYDDDGNLIETNNEGAWLAGVNGALPGYIMPVDLTVDFEYFQEFAENDEALDVGRIFATGELISLEIGEFHNVLRTLETNPFFEPDSREFKYYVPGLGLILIEEGLNEALEDPELVVELVDIVTVPEPPSVILLSFGLMGLLLFKLKKTDQGYLICKLPR